MIKLISTKQEIWDELFHISKTKSGNNSVWFLVRKSVSEEIYYEDVYFKVCYDVIDYIINFHRNPLYLAIQTND